MSAEVAEGGVAAAAAAAQEVRVDVPAAAAAAPGVEPAGLSSVASEAGAPLVASPLVASPLAAPPLGESRVEASPPEASPLVVGVDGLARPAWASRDPLMREYYDTEWGMPVRDERGIFERLSLEAFQSGLSWATILRKRPAFREAFAGFEPDTVAGFDEADFDRLMADAGIVRNRLKIGATIQNAAATVALREEGGLAEFVWSFQPTETPRPVTFADIPSSSSESVALSRALKKKGFTFVGPTTMFALMEAIGIVDTHLVGSYRRGSSGVWAQ